MLGRAEHLIGAELEAGEVNTGASYETGAIIVTDTGTVHDWAPAGFANARYVIFASGGNLTVNGLAGGTDGRVITLMITTATGSVSFGNENGGSAPENRFHNLGASTQSITGGANAAQSITYRYNGAAQRWQQVSASVTTHGEAVNFSGIVTIASQLVGSSSTNPSALSGTTHDWAPTAALRTRIALSAAATVTGLASGVSDGRIRILHNVETDATRTLTLTHEDSGSTAANRFLCPGGSNVTLRAGGSVLLYYDGTSSRWRVLPLEGATVGKTVFAGATQTDSTASGTISDLALGESTTLLRFNPSGLLTVAGLSGGVDGRLLVVFANGADVVLSSENAAAAAANRITIATGSFTLPSGSSAILVYDGAALRWRVLAGAARRFANDTTFQAALSVNGDTTLGDATSDTVRIGGSSGPQIKQGTGSPEGVVTAPVGSIYFRTDGGAGSTFYVKESGAGNTGWVAK